MCCTDRGSVASDLHGPQLKPCPGGVELGRPDEGQVHAEGAVDGGTVDTQEDSVGDARPRRR